MSAEALIAAALALRARAHAPYSGFHVGAAVLDEQGRIHAACNVENASYPLGVCAEAGAISAMVAAGGTRIVMAAVAGPDGTLCTPCGGCRQRLREFCAPDAPVLVRDASGGVRAFTMEGLLPESFGPEVLGGAG